MKSNRWLPIIIMLCLTGLGVFVGVNTILNTKRSKPLVSSKSVSTLSTPVAVNNEAKKETIAVLRGIDKEAGRIGVYLVNEMKETSFAYDLATSVKSMNDEELVMPEKYRYFKGYA